jgi:hypothetical protein
MDDTKIIDVKIMFINHVDFQPFTIVFIDRKHSILEFPIPSYYSKHFN